MCKREFKQYGFKPYRNNHYRIINSIFQSFCLHRSVYGNTATVEFVILSLAQEYKIDKLTCGADHLRKFENSAEWFLYENKSDKSIDECIVSMMGYMNKYLIPFFQYSTTSKNAYNAICELDRINNSQLNEYTKLILSLKNQEYSVAELHMKNIISQSEYAYKRNKEVYGNNISSEYVKKIEAKIKHKNQFLQRIINKDFEFLQEWLQKNEENNLQSLGATK